MPHLTCSCHFGGYLAPKYLGGLSATAAQIRRILRAAAILGAIWLPNIWGGYLRQLRKSAASYVQLPFLGAILLIGRNITPPNMWEQNSPHKYLGDKSEIAH